MAAALIRLLFVAVSLRLEAAMGTGASAKAQAVAGSAFAAALGRAWSLMQGRHTTPAQETQTQET